MGWRLRLLWRTLSPPKEPVKPDWMHCGRCDLLNDSCELVEHSDRDGREAEPVKPIKGEG